LNVMRKEDSVEVKINSNKVILKSFSGWLPLALVSLVFYGMIFVVLVMYIMTNLFGIEEASARQIGWLIGSVLLAFLAYLYLKWLLKSLSSYRLSVSGEMLKVKGKAGWKSLDVEIPVHAVQKITIGESENAAEQLLSGYGAICDQVASRLVFTPVSGKSFKLDFAAKAFNNESLYEFLLFVRSRGIQTNVSV